MGPGVAEEEGQALGVAFLQFRAQAVIPRHGLRVIVRNICCKVRVLYPVEVAVRGGNRRDVVDNLSPFLHAVGTEVVGFEHRRRGDLSLHGSRPLLHIAISCAAVLNVLALLAGQWHR